MKLWTRDVSRSDFVRTTVGACTLTRGQQRPRSAHSNPKFRLNITSGGIAMMAPSIPGAPTHAFYRTAGSWTAAGGGLVSRIRSSHHFAAPSVVNFGFERTPGIYDSSVDFGSLVDEFGTEFAADPPGEAALTGMARRQDDGEFSGNFGVLGNDLHAALRHVGDHAIAWQRAGPELNPGDPSALLSFAFAPIHQHLGPSSPLDNGSSAVSWIYKRTVGISLAAQLAIDWFCSIFIYRLISIALKSILEPAFAAQKRSGNADQNGHNAT